MICPNCKTESFGAKWCPECGLRLELDDITNTDFINPEKGDTQKLRPITTQNDESYKTVPPASARKSTGKSTANYEKKASHFTDRGFNYWLIAIGVVSVLIVLFVIFRFVGIIPTADDPKMPASGEEVVLEKEDSSKIIKTGLDELKLGNYDEAETVFKAVLETDPDNDEADTIYKIVYNYNRALKKIQSAKYTEAREFFDKIPLEYENYSIKTDVENLDDEISSFESAYESFNKVQQHMAAAMYEDALNTISLIDKNFLSGADAEMLGEYTDEIEKFFEEQEKKDKSDDDMSVKKAEIIITTYCEDLVMAVNSRDFSIVEKHMSGQLYNDQKKFVQSSIDNSLTQSFDKLEIKAVYPVSDTKWKIGVSESETTYYPDGTQKPETRNLTYTIEYIDSEYYLTAVE